MPSSLELPITTLRALSDRRLDQLLRIGIQSVGDLLYHLPRAFEDLTDVRSIDELCQGKIQTVQGEVVEIGGRQLVDGRSVISIVLSDGKDILEGVWFNQVYMARKYRYGQRLAFSGKPKKYMQRWQMTTPRVSELEGEGDFANGSAVVPIYSLTEDLRADHLRDLIRLAVDQFGEEVPEIIPESLQRYRRLPPVRQALRDVHAPATVDAGQTARRRFIYEEFLVLQAGLALRRREMRDRLRAPVLASDREIDQRIRKLFSFAFTADQDRAVADIQRDLASTRPMQRLLQADVGAGKTAVAIYGLLVAVANQHQGVILTPTEVLAQQHWRTIEGYLAASRVRRALLTGSLTAAERRRTLEAAKSGELDLVVGTQALLSEDVQFAKLGLVVVDEQHRFGVNQRARVRRLGVDPHYLVMTATPIPRTLALTVFGDLDTSIIRQQPPGRQPVATRWVKGGEREQVYERLRSGLRDGRQGYVVCPLVEESATLDVKAAVQTHEELQSGAFQDFRVGLLHGGMDDEEKDRVMVAFRGREIDLLVCTSVIEVGVDVANATLLVVEHAERFGLSQLHQLRGRVSRGTAPGQCFVFADPITEDARERLRLFCRTTDGFALAEHDARLRGVGDFFGTRQHGLGALRFGDLIADRAIMDAARTDAFQLVAADAGLRQPEHAALRATVLRRYGETFDLPDIG
jgi:ATP-dependent DNA helicase RecG